MFHLQHSEDMLDMPCILLYAGKTFMCASNQCGPHSLHTLYLCLTASRLHFVRVVSAVSLSFIPLSYSYPSKVCTGICNARVFSLKCVKHKAAQQKRGISMLLDV